MDAIFAGMEFKFAGDAATGEFSGYASVFGNQDSHGDLILPGAFTETLAEKKAQGRTIPMHVMHSFGGDGLPIGVWKNISEDQSGLFAEGKISGMNTDAGRLLYEKVKDGALGGISIGYRVKSGGSKLGKAAGEPKRILSNLHLGEISLVDEPSNALTRVNEIKSAMMAAAGVHTPDGVHMPDMTNASNSVAAAIKMHDAYMSDPRTADTSVKDKALMMAHLMDAHQHLTGSRVPDGVMGWKGAQLFQEMEKFLEGKGLSTKEIAEMADRGFKSLLTHVEKSEPAVKPISPLHNLAGLLSDFSLSSFK